MDNKEDVLSIIEDSPIGDTSPSEKIHTFDLSNILKFALRETRFVVKDMVMSNGECVLTIGDTFSRVNDYEVRVTVKPRS